MPNSIRVARSVLPAALLATTMLTAAPALAQSANPPMLEEVVITAQKRTENLQRVPINVQAIGTERLEELNVTDFNDYVKYLPSVAYQTVAPGFSNVYMRGVASGGDGNHSGSLPSVGIYLDEQPITTIQGALDIHVYDIARVESLSGPQGTLYGASSQAGTIRIITNKPDTSGFSAAYDVEVNHVAHGGLGALVEGFVNIPITEKAAVRLVGWMEHDSGYIDNVFGTRTYPTWGGTIDNAAFTEENYNYVDTVGMRAALKLDLNENWTVTPTVMVQRERSNGLFAFDPLVGDLEVTHFNPETGLDKWMQAALTVEGKIGNFDLTYAGAYLRRTVAYQQDYSDYSFFYDTLAGYGAYWYDDAGNFIDPSQYIRAKDGYIKHTHELRLSTPRDWRLRGLIGGYISRQSHDIQQRYMITSLSSDLEVPGWDDTIWLTKQYRVDRDYAIFGEASFDITDRLTFTGGVRLFRSDNSLAGFFGFGEGYSGSTGVSQCFGAPIDPSAPCLNLDKEVEEDGFTHKLNLTYQIDDERMIYATWSTGFRPGGLNRRGTLPPYQSDVLTNYEAGWKTTWLDGRLRWNGAVYYETWDDFQFSVLGSQGLTEIKNAGQARMYGIESDVMWRVSEGLTLTGSAAYTNAELSENFCGTVDANGDPETNCLVPQAPKGTELPVTPKFKANLVARYEFPVGEYNAFVQGAYVYNGSAWTDLRLIERAIIGKQPAYNVFDLSAGVKRDNWRVSVFADNLFDERASIYRYAECAEAVCGAQTYIVPNRPRTIGIKFGQDF